MPLNTARWNQLRYTAYAPFYDLLVRPFHQARRRAIALLHLQGDERILIVGAGTGLDLRFLPRSAQITAIDITPAMLHRTAARGQQLGHQVTLAVMNAEALSFPANSFDCVLLHLVLAVVPDPHACIREAARVLKPGGQISIFDKFLPDDTAPSPVRRAANAVTNVAFSDINRQLGPLLGEAKLTLRHQEAAGLGEAYRIAQVSKEG